LRSVFDALNQSLYLLVNKHSRGKRASTRHFELIRPSRSYRRLGFDMGEKRCSRLRRDKADRPLGRPANEHSPHQFDLRLDHGHRAGWNHVLAKTGARRAPRRPRASGATRVVDPKKMDSSIWSLIRYGEPDEMADAVAFLAGPRSKYISGRFFGWTAGKRCFRAEDWPRLASGGLKSVGRQTV
jgi:hypothetical protein